ncbi:MAG: DNA polymerase III subunit delta, partial [Clostridia bacterium]|nr:DNA polymerase III subunit delta [Clostridia bacterium]
MAKFTEEGLKSAIKSQTFAPVYVLYGDEQYLVNHYVNQLANTLVGDIMPDFNLSRLSGETTYLGQIIESAEGLPMMHNHRCVLVWDYSPAEETDSTLKDWEAYLSDPCEGNVVVFYYTTVKPGNSKNWKTFLSSCEKYGGVLTLNKKTQAEIVKILCSGAGKRGCRISASTAGYLVECVGEDLNTLLCELEKLCAFKANQEITNGDIDRLCHKTLSATAFQMIREINRKNSSGALRILHHLYQMREDPIKILGALYSSYVNMYRALTADEARLP